MSCFIQPYIKITDLLTSTANHREAKNEHPHASNRHYHERRDRPRWARTSTSCVRSWRSSSKAASRSAKRKQSCPSRSWWAAIRRNWKRSRPEAGVAKWTTDLDEALGRRAHNADLFRRPNDGAARGIGREAIAAGKHIYCEKPTATNTAEALELYRLAKKAGVKNGVVQDKLWLPGLFEDETPHRRRLLRPDSFRPRRVRLLGLRGRYGPRAAPLVELPERRGRGHHPRHALPLPLRAPTTSSARFGAVSCLGATHVPKRWDEAGKPYDCTAEDSAYSSFELAGGIVAHIDASWCYRVRRDDLLVLQVDGNKGSAVAGLRHCWAQAYADTPRPVWNPDIDSPIDFHDGWQKILTDQTYDNAFKAEWELFLRHVRQGRTVPLDAARGRQGRATRRKRRGIVEKSQVGRNSEVGGIAWKSVTYSYSRKEQCRLSLRERTRLSRSERQLQEPIQCRVENCSRRVSPSSLREAFLLMHGPRMLPIPNTFPIRLATAFFRHPRVGANWD